MFRKLSVAAALVVAVSCFDWFTPIPSMADGESPGCQTFASLSGQMTFSGFLGLSNYRMDNSAFAPGDVVTVSVAWVSAPIPSEFEIATLTIAAHPFAIPLTSRTAIPGTLTYLYSGPIQVGGEPVQGLGFALGTVNFGDSGTVNITTSCNPASASALPGPGVPSGFGLHRITCTVAVYDSPGGSPVGSSELLNGQTWFASATPVSDKQGASWTEVFVGGVHDGFIPTRCVQ